MYFFIDWPVSYRTSELGTAINECPSLQNRKSYRPNRKSLVMQKLTSFLFRTCKAVYVHVHTQEILLPWQEALQLVKRKERCMAAAFGRDSILPAWRKQAQLPHMGVWEPSCCAVTWNNTRRMNVWCWLMTGGVIRLSLDERTNWNCVPAPTPWSWFISEKLIVSQLVRNFPVFYGTPRYRVYKFLSTCLYPELD